MRRGMRITVGRFGHHAHPPFAALDRVAHGDEAAFRYAVDRENLAGREVSGVDDEAVGQPQAGARQAGAAVVEPVHGVARLGGVVQRGQQGRLIQDFDATELVFSLRRTGGGRRRFSMRWRHAA